MAEVSSVWYIEVDIFACAAGRMDRDCLLKKSALSRDSVGPPIPFPEDSTEHRSGWAAFKDLPRNCGNMGLMSS